MLSRHMPASLVPEMNLDKVEEKLKQAKEELKEAPDEDAKALAKIAVKSAQEGVTIAQDGVKSAQEVVSAYRHALARLVGSPAGSCVWDGLFISFMVCLFMMVPRDILSCLSHTVAPRTGAKKRKRGQAIHSRSHKQSLLCISLPRIVHCSMCVCVVNIQMPESHLQQAWSSSCPSRTPM